MQRTLLLDIVVAQRPPVLQLFPGEDQSLLIRRDSLLVLNLGLDIVDRVAGFDLEGDGLPRQGLDEDLHTSSETEDQVKGRFLLDVYMAARKGANRSVSSFLLFGKERRNDDSL